MQVTAHALDSFYIRSKKLPESLREKIIQDNTLLFFEEKACAPCEFLPERKAASSGLSGQCEQCAAFKGGAALASQVKKGNNRYMKIPIGDSIYLKKVMDKAGLDLVVKEKFPVVPFKRAIKFTGTFKGDYQKDAANAIIKMKRGVIKAPPRSGKTVIFSAAVTKIGQKTLILASQREWLLGFKETFIGSPTQEALTTCKPSQIGIAKKYEDFLKYDICLVTVQTFYSESGQNLLRRIRNMFPVVGVDEIHTGAAPKYAAVLSQLNCKWKIGLSGTPSRKDGRFSIMRKLIGPNIYEAKVERLRPQIRLVRTEYTQNSKGRQMWARLVSGLEKDPKRLKLIAQWALKDVEDGHMVLIPFAQVTPIKALTKAINIMAGKTIAYPFYGGLQGKMMYKGEMTKKRDVYLQAARKYKIKVLVGNIKLLSTGTNIPRASAIYEVTPSSNLENVEQRISRVLTPYEGKPQPIARLFLDNMNIRKRCMSHEWFRCIVPKFRPIISDRDSVILKEWFKETRPGFSNSPIEL
jgi:superfamily II DNA or RNA helicase